MKPRVSGKIRATGAGVSTARARRRSLAVAVAIASAFASRPVHADLCTGLAPVFAGDPCDPVTGPYPMMPGLPLVLPADGPTGRWNDAAPVITGAMTGDVDLAVRVGTHASASAIPGPAGSTTGPALLQNVAGGGSAMQGTAVPFTTFVTDGPGATDYGVPLPGLDQRPLAVFAYADLDGDGVIGPTDLDGSADNEIEKQEALGHVGRQVGQISGDRFSNAIAVRVGAPASIGGLRVALVSGMYTGDDAGQLWTNGTPIFTNWPFFPPLDPLQVIFLAEANPPDPNGPNIVYYQASEFLLPAPSTADLPEKFVLQTDGSNPSTDQFLSLSGPAVGVRVFRSVLPGSFTASSRNSLRLAPATTGPVPKPVLPVNEMTVSPGQDVEVRLLPVDSLGNVADPSLSGFSIRLGADGGLRISSPDLDADPYTETINITDARGALVHLDTTKVSGIARLTLVDAPPALPTGLDQLTVRARATPAAPVDEDDDGVPDDGDDDGVAGDHPCTAAAVLADTPCDDNCPSVVNPAQDDTDLDGQGNCCDGTCVLDDGADGCAECPQSASRFQAAVTWSRLRILPGAGVKDDRVQLKAFLPLGEGQSVTPDAEPVEFVVAERDRLHWLAQLPGSFSAEGSALWTYDDPSAAIGGVVRARIRATTGGLRLRVTARGVSLVDTVPADPLPRGLVLGVTIGEDAFTRRLACRSSIGSVRCGADR